MQIKADRPLTRDMLNAPWLLTNRQFRWTGNGHSQLLLAELGKLRGPSAIAELLVIQYGVGQTDKRHHADARDHHCEIMFLCASPTLQCAMIPLW